MEKNLYNTTVGVRKWMMYFRELNVDVGFERKMERTRMLSSVGYIISLDTSSSTSLLISVINFHIHLFAPSKQM
jgi:hypothetical protein